MACKLKQKTTIKKGATAPFISTTAILFLTENNSVALVTNEWRVFYANLRVFALINLIDSFAYQ